MLFTIYSAKSQHRKETTGNHALSKEDFLSHAHPLVVHELFFALLLIWILKQVRIIFIKKVHFKAQKEYKSEIIVYQFSTEKSICE